MVLPVVYLVGPTRSDELRYSLRSLRNVDHGPVWIVGHCPDWARPDEYVPSTQNDPAKYRRVNADLLLAAEKIGGPFAYWNDDHYAVRSASYPMWHAGPVFRPRPGRGPLGPWRTSIMETGKVLRTVFGVAKPIDWELHIPQVLHGPVLLDVAARAPDPLALQLRTLYSNAMGLDGVQAVDVKTNCKKRLWPEGSAWASTNEHSFAHNAGRVLRELFPEPSPYEVV